MRAENQVLLVPPAILPTGVADLDTVLTAYIIDVVEPTKVVVVPEADHILTWYKLHVDETISRQPTVHAAGALPTIPAELLPLGSNDIIVRISGGTIVVDGVTVKEQAAADLAPHQKYLMFLYLQALQNGSNFGALAAFRAGIFLLQPNGTLKALGQASHPLVREIRDKFANQLEGIRSYALKRMR